MRRFALAALLLAIGLVIARAPVIRPSLGGALLANAREVAVYRLGPGPVRFALPPGKRSLRVLVNLDLVPPVLADGVPYAVRVEIPEDGFTASFPLLATPAVDKAGGPAAFYLGEAGAPARTRDVAVERRGDGPATATISLEAPAGATASLRLLTAEPRPPLARDVLLGRLGPEGRARLATSVGPLDWDQLDDGVREGLLDRRWTRAAAGPGAPSRRLYVVSVPAPAHRAPRPRGELVGGGRVAAFTVRGPGTLHLAALDVPLRGEASRLDTDGTTSVFPLSLGPGDRASLPIPEGLSTVRVMAASLARVVAVGDLRMAVDPGRLRALPGGEAELEPVWAVELSPLGAPEPAPPLAFDLAGRGAEALRVSVRALVEAGAGETRLRVRWRVLDGRGAEVAAGELPFTVRPAPEDRIDSDEARVPAQPAAFYLWPPSSAERLEVRADRPAAIGLSSPGFPPDPLVGTKPGLADGLLLRFQTEERPSWFRLRPKDEPALWAASRMVTLRSALRLEEAPRPPVPPSQAESIEPLGGIPRLLLVAPATAVPGNGEPASEAPGRGNWWPIPPGVETVVVLSPPAGSAPDARVQPSLLYAGEPALAGREALVTVDGRALPRALLASPRGQLVLPFLAAGRRRLRVDAGAPARLFVDQPAPGSALHHAYGTFELEAGAPLRLRLQKSAASRSLGVTLYFDGRPSPRARLVARIDGGVRAPRAGSTSLGWTGLERQAPVRAAASEGAFYLNRTTGPVWTTEPVFIPLHDDLGPGAHEIAVSVQNAGTRVFARFFAYGSSGPAEHVSHVHEIHTESPPVIPVLIAMLAAAPTPTVDAVYSEARRYDRAGFRFSPPPGPRLERLRALAADIVHGLAAGGPPRPLRDRAAADGLDLVAARDPAGEVWLLREAGARREGDGLYVFRPGGSSVCVQAPHTFFDEGTGPIALAVFAELRAACLFVNTVHRSSRSAGGDGLADAAHAERTVFRAMTGGIVEASHWAVAQLHGFAGHEELGPGVAAVVSDGATTRPEGAPAARLREALARRLAPGRVLLFGEDAKVLGATTNVIGADVRKEGRRFLHVELSATSRRRLRDGGVTPLAAALAEALEVKP